MLDKVKGNGEILLPRYIEDGDNAERNVGWRSIFYLHCLDQLAATTSRGRQDSEAIKDESRW